MIKCQGSGINEESAVLSSASRCIERSETGETKMFDKLQFVDLVPRNLAKITTN